MQFFSIDIGPVIEWIRSIIKRRKERISIKQPYLSRPDVIATYDPEEWTISPDDDLPFEFGLAFRFESKSPKSVDGCSYAVVFEHTEIGPTNNRTTTNFQGEYEHYDGLIEPELSPVIIRTDLQEYVRFLSEDLSTHDSGRLRIDDEIEVRIKVTAEEVTADVYTISLHRIMRDWVSDCAGFDMRAFIDDPTAFDGNIEDLPSMIVDEDVGTEIRRIR